MGELKKSIIINAPIDEVFTHLTESIVSPEWIGKIGRTPLEVKHRAPGPVKSGFTCVKKGTRIWREHRGTMGPVLIFKDHYEEFERTIVVTEFVLNERLAFQAETVSRIDYRSSPSSRYIEDYDYVTRAASNGATLATVSYDKRFRPQIRLLNLMLQPVYWALFPVIRLRRIWRMARHLRSIKKNVESNKIESAAPG